MEQVSVASNVLDLYSPKFGLDAFGKDQERIVIKVVLPKDSSRVSLYGSYTIGTRHAQISTDFLGTLGGTVNIESVSRFTLDDAISEINSLNRGRIFHLALDGGNLLANVESRRIPVAIKRIYTVGGSLYLLVQVLGKKLKIGLSSDGVRLCDSSNREVAGLSIVGNRLVVKRKFQNPDLAATFTDPISGQ